MALIEPGYTYKFQFVKKFEGLNGVYTIAKIYSWAEVVKDQLSIYESIYSPLKISQEEYNKDIQEYRDVSILKLVSPINGKEIYVPQSILSPLPLYTVKEYQNLVLFLPLGIYDDEEGLDYLVNQVCEEIHGTLGITETPRITTVGKSYLTTEEYREITERRDADKTSVLNWFSETIKLKEENNKLKAQLAGYKKIVESSKA